MGHHPPRSCLASFGWNFYKIINRLDIKNDLELLCLEIIVYLDMKIRLLVNFMDIHIMMNF